MASGGRISCLALATAISLALCGACTKPNDDPSIGSQGKGGAAGNNAGGVAGGTSGSGTPDSAEGGAGGAAGTGGTAGSGGTGVGTGGASAGGAPGGGSGTGDGPAGAPGSGGSGSSMPMPSCTAGTLRCSASTPAAVEECRDGLMWTVKESCPGGCAGTACCGTGTEAVAGTCGTCGAEGGPCCKIAKPDCAMGLACAMDKCVVPCGDGPGQKCCEDATKPCSNNCGKGGTQTCKGGSYGKCSQPDVACCGPEACSANCNQKGTKPCNNGVLGACSVKNLDCCPGDKCASASCKNNTEFADTFCDSNGKCNQKKTNCTNGLACAGTRCASACNEPFEGCQKGRYCATLDGLGNQKCNPLKPLGGSCNDPGGFDCASTRCDSVDQHQCCDGSLAFPCP